jgi:hypothetical protein
MKRVACFTFAIALMLVVTPGCGRSVVKDDKTFELAPGDVYTLYIPACKKFDVNFTTKDNVPVSAYVMSKSDGDESISAKSVKGKKLATQDSKANGKLSYTSADKVEMAVVFESRVKATVTAKITGE